SVHTAKSLKIKQQKRQKACKSSILQAFSFLSVPSLGQDKAMFGQSSVTKSLPISGDNDIGNECRDKALICRILAQQKGLI
ncbi:MAG: hypothetical protein LBM08_08785, partial [Dysgonamonadaceae bacterium]|nr:hypothetical protein [Dysgonamonadaceae bacterium]